MQQVTPLPMPGNDLPPLANVLVRVGNELESLELKIKTLHARLERAIPNVPRAETPATPKRGEITSAYVDAAVELGERIAKLNDQVQFILDSMEV
jgi:hypothetical protein